MNESSNLSSQNDLLWNINKSETIKIAITRPHGEISTRFEISSQYLKEEVIRRGTPYELFDIRRGSPYNYELLVSRKGTNPTNYLLVVETIWHIHVCHTSILLLGYWGMTHVYSHSPQNEPTVCTSSYLLHGGVPPGTMSQQTLCCCIQFSRLA